MYVVTGHGLGYLSAKQPGANPLFFLEDIHGFLLVGPPMLYFLIFSFFVGENVFSSLGGSINSQIFTSLICF